MFLTGTAMVQTDPALIDRIGRIATAQTVMMVVTLVLAVGLAILGLLLVKAVSRTLSKVEKVLDELAPRAKPLIDGVSQVAEDANAISHAVRRKVEDVLDTVDDVNERVRSAADATEQRVRQFGAVLDVIQDEAQDLLLDAASTARGVHEAARTVRQRRPPRRLPRPADEFADDE